MRFPKPTNMALTLLPTPMVIPAGLGDVFGFKEAGDLEIPQRQERYISASLSAIHFKCVVELIILIGLCFLEFCIARGVSIIEEGLKFEQELAQRRINSTTRSRKARIREKGDSIVRVLPPCANKVRKRAPVAPAGQGGRKRSRTLPVMQCS